VAKCQVATTILPVSSIHSSTQNNARDSLHFHTDELLCHRRAAMAMASSLFPHPSLSCCSSSPACSSSSSSSSRIPLTFLSPRCYHGRTLIRQGRSERRQNSRATALDETPVVSEADPGRIVSLKLNLLVGSIFFYFLLSFKVTYFPPIIGGSRLK
jgi:hypothetical protein